MTTVNEDHRQSGPTSPVERRIGSVPNGEGVSILVKYNGLNLDFFLTVDQAVDLVVSLRKSLEGQTVRGVGDEEVPN